MELIHFIGVLVQCSVLYNSYGFLKTTKAQLVQVTTAYGIVEGMRTTMPGTANILNLFMGKPLYKFLGIPYAQPPVGPLRFKSPQAPKKWAGVKGALLPGSICTQSIMNVDFGTEDCLYMNVYTPRLPKKGIPLKPVMVFIHGGGFLLGDGYLLYGSDFIVPKDVILVTFNYRLGAQGFLSLEDDILSGNYGLKDQLQALRWVKQNIARFGGNPNKVTLFGESAGSASVHYHILSPLSKGLFQQAILQSGTAVCPWAFNPKPKEIAVLLARELGYNSTNVKQLYNFFMNASPYDLSRTSFNIFLQNTKSINLLVPELVFLPCVEVEGKGEKFITRTPRELLQEGNFTKVPLIIGTMNGEGAIALLKTWTDGDIKSANMLSDWVIPFSWNLKPGEVKNTLGQKIKKHYFGNEITWSKMNQLISVYTDLFMVMEIQYSISAHLNHSDTPIYNYEFIYPTSTSLRLIYPMLQLQIHNLQAASHADELSLLFPINNILLQFLPIEKEISDNMVKMWTNFAKTGNPNFSGMKAHWKPLEKNSLSHLEIGSSLKFRKGKVRQQNLQFWKTMCEESSVDYTCGAL